MRPWKNLSRRVILNYSSFLRVESHRVALPNGRIINDWPWVVTPDYVNVIAVDDNGRFLCFRQTKYAVADTSLAPVGGYLDPDEDPLTAAQRELLEELGAVADRWTHLGSFAVDGNRGAGTAHLYLAQGVSLVATPAADDLEEQTLLRLTQAEMTTALARGEFKVLSWATAVALALRVIDAPGMP